MTAVARVLARPVYEIYRTASAAGFHLAGWRFEGKIPDADKFLVVAAPHTSNWDLPIMLGIAAHFRRRLHWVGKASLFKPPFGGVMRALGGVPVERGAGANFVSDIVDEFRARERFVIGILPEGTRQKVREWRSGFYHIAQGAGVPIVLGFVDYARKAAGVGGVIEPSGDYEADLARIKAFYAGVTGKHPERA
ncbi:MAG: lysophospholipid acyltransferase family protein [Pseudomonadota bacterium]